MCDKLFCGRATPLTCLSLRQLENYGSALADAIKAVEIDSTYIKAYYRCGSDVLHTRAFDSLFAFARATLQTRNPLKHSVFCDSQARGGVLLPEEV